MSSLWIDMPSHVPPAVRSLILQRRGARPIEYHYRPADEASEELLSDEVAQRVHCVHVAMWRISDFPIDDLMFPLGNEFVDLKHICFHAGPTLISESLEVLSSRMFFRFPREKMTSASFIFSPDCEEPYLHYPTMISDWLFQYDFIETIVVENMGVSAEERHPIEFKIECRLPMTFGSLKRLEFKNCRAQAVSRLFLMVNLPAFEEFWWNSKRIEARFDNDLMFFQVPASESATSHA